MTRFPIEAWQAAERDVARRFYPPTGNSPLAANPMAELDPELSELLQVIARGRHYNDETIDLKTRCLCTVACLVTMGEQAYAQNWITNALTAGATKEEVVALISQLSAYLTTPALVRGYAAAKEAFVRAAATPPDAAGDGEGAGATSTRGETP